MVEAYKAKPELEAKIDALRTDCEWLESHLRQEEDLSRSLLEQIAQLNYKLAEVSRERDDAMFRNLELEELKDKVGGLVGQALGLFKSSSPEPTQPVTQPEAASPIMSQSEPMAFGIEETDMPSAKPADTSIWPVTDFHGPLDPVVVESQPPVESVPQPSPEPDFDQYSETTYRNKPYAMKPWWVNDMEWEKFGGKPNPATEVDFQF